MDLHSGEKKNSSAVIFLAKLADTPILKITTKTGRKIVLSSDHPILSDSEFKEAGNIKRGDNIAIHPFVGVEYDEPSDEVFLDEKDLIPLTGGREKVIRDLKKNGLLPLRYNSEKLPILAKFVEILIEPVV